MLETDLVPTRHPKSHLLAMAGLACVATVASIALFLDRKETACTAAPIVEVVQRPAPAPIAPPAPAPAPPAPPAPDCSLSYFSIADGETAPIEKWTVSETHLGPFTACDKIDLAFVKRAMPGYDVTQTGPDQWPPDFITVKQRGKTVLTMWPGDATAGRELHISIHDRRFATPWGMRVGDSLGTLRGRHRGIDCAYGATIDAGEHMSCFRLPGDGWLDTLKYSLDLSPLGVFMKSDRSFFDTDAYHQKLERWHHLRIDAIGWSPAKPAP